MRSKIKTGDVIQITKNGPNYITLGKVRGNDDVDYLAVTRNGNISQGGFLKRGHPSTLATGPRVIKPTIHVIGGARVKKVHSHRPVDMESIVRGSRRMSTHLQRTTRITGVFTDAPNVLVQIAELEAAIQ